MKLHFEPDLDYQLEAIEAVCELFRGQETCRTEFTVTRDTADAQMRLGFAQNDLGIGNRMILVSACYSGVFVPILSSDTSIVVTAASAERSSFGCVSDNDWTFFGDALINHALRKPQPLSVAVNEATNLIAGWEGSAKLLPSQPQASFGAGAARWLAALEARSPRLATAPVGRPAIDSIKDVPAER